MCSPRELRFAKRIQGLAFELVLASSIETASQVPSPKFKAHLLQLCICSSALLVHDMLALRSPPMNTDICGVTMRGRVVLMARDHSEEFQNGI